MADRTHDRIRGLSERRRLPRIAKLRLGVKKATAKGQEYPSEVSYFVAREEDFRRPEAFRRYLKIYGDKATEIDIFFPVEDPRIFFPQSFKKYGGGILRCRGDGYDYIRFDKETGEVSEGECPGPDGCEFAIGKNGRLECGAVANLIFLIPSVSWAGTFQIDTGSKTAIVGLNSAIDYYRTLAGRISMVPLKLRRVPTEITYEGKKSTHYILDLAFPESEDEIRKALSGARKMREVFEIFKPGEPTLALPGPKEIEGDLRPREEVRDHLSCGGTDAAPEDVDSCANCGNVVREGTEIVFQGDVYCSDDCLAAMKDRLARISTEPEIASDEKEAERAREAPKPPKLPKKDDGEDGPAAAPARKTLF